MSQAGRFERLLLAQEAVEAERFVAKHHPALSDRRVRAALRRNLLAAAEGVIAGTLAGPVSRRVFDGYAIDHAHAEPRPCLAWRGWSAYVQAERELREDIHIAAPWR